MLNLFCTSFKYNGYPLSNVSASIYIIITVAYLRYFKTNTHEDECRMSVDKDLGCHLLRKKEFSLET